MRICKICNTLKPEGDYYIFKKQIAPYKDTLCKPCRKENTRKSKERVAARKQTEIINEKELAVEQIHMIQSRPWR